MTYDLAIGDHGMAPLLLARVLAKVSPALRLAVFTRDAEPGGDGLELVLPDRLSPVVRALMVPIAVRKWDRYVVRRGGMAMTHDEPVWLLDPLQLQLELELLDHPPAFFAGRDLAERRGPPPAQEVIILPAGPTSLHSTRIIGAAGLEGLSEPVLADFDVVAGEAMFLQYIPLGDERVGVCSVHYCPEDHRRDPASILCERWDAVSRIAERLGQPAGPYTG